MVNHSSWLINQTGINVTDDVGFTFALNLLQVRMLYTFLLLKIKNIKL
jgi:hypothetical protein